MEASVTSKNPLFREEKISVRRMGKMSSNCGEIIRKLYFLVWWNARQRATHATPHLSASSYRTFYTFGWDVRDLLVGITRGGGGEGGVICETVPFVNRSSDQLQAQNQDSQYYSASSLFKQDLSNSYWWLLASFGEFI
jgi:hypothetical protein